VSSSQAGIETEDVMTAFQGTTTTPESATALATGNDLVRDHQEETEDITVETGQGETIEMIHASVRDPVEASR